MNSRKDVKKFMDACDQKERNFGNQSELYPLEATIFLKLFSLPYWVCAEGISEYHSYQNPH